MNDLVKTLRSELATLERELQADARYVKVQRIKELLTAYAPEKDIAPKPTPKQQRRPTRKGARKHVPSAAAAPSKAKGVQHEVEALLTTKGRLHRKEILAHLVSKGLMGKEKTPMANLAAYLSSWRSMVETDGKGNFKLRAEWLEKNKAPTSELPAN
jgi:hypothetical protein